MISNPCTDRYYYYYNSGLQQQYVLYSQSSLDAPASVLIDPNTLSTDGTVSLKVCARVWIYRFGWAPPPAHYHHLKEVREGLCAF